MRNRYIHFILVSHDEKAVDAVRKAPEKRARKSFFRSGVVYYRSVIPEIVSERPPAKPYSFFLPEQDTIIGLLLVEKIKAVGFAGGFLFLKEVVGCMKKETKETLMPYADTLLSLRTLLLFLQIRKFETGCRSNDWRFLGQ